MMRPRRPRQLTAEERKLWAEVLRGVTPFGGRTLPELPAPLPEEPRPACGSPSPALPRMRAGRSLPPLAPLERRLRVGLRRGTRPVDSAIDLHGMRQAEAHHALLGFLRRSQAAGHSVVLVVTGKGGRGTPGDLFDERGILRRVVPHWLRLPEMRPLVIGFDEAEPQHGGTGALYVRLRRRREPSR